jgi:ribosomal protein S18 acetylase RimI-like enzyme
LAIFERRTHVCHYTWEEFDHQVQKTLEEQESIWSLGFTWIHRKYRRHGLAQILFQEAVGYLGVRTDAVGLYTPFSSDGEAWARSIFQEGFLVAK